MNRNGKNILPPLPYDTASGAYYEKFTNLMSDGRNAGISSKDTSKKAVAAMNSMMPKYMVHSQSLWDATAILSISKVFTKTVGQKFLQLNGRFHSDEGLGTVTQLKKYNPKLRILVISCIDGGKKFPKDIDVNENKKLGDFVIYTDPSVPRTYKE
ncbi:MAG: ChaN family lipoprotein [Sphingobacteriaceae bacterium]|nr:ChaN family lipoprotein [Sphingobacteriaceae bacterium]